MTVGECAAMLAIAGKVYGREIRPELVGVWHEFMLDITSEEGARSMRQHVAESPHFPTIADIRRRVAEVRVDAPALSEAWEEVRKQIAKVGSYGVPVFSHPAVERAVEALGWREICMTLEEDAPTLRAQFERYLKSNLEAGNKAANHGALEQARTGESLPAGELLKRLALPGRGV